ncbi:Protein of unknown function [Cnuella takakiae]|uniref:DUF2029 domain-containing protein n=1 Tax=Cnuella takakiae TaxID=1302690 RepID=A0A1M4Y4L6_9BACT|nr:glycosyltransferase family 87 protein [Cnuella takakiae]OLY94864.1 hypothetical protein BUE76_14915 [Cnuella takakiae]SHF00523.1 Protein of unknown function [Cnuella takakiae]
MQALYQSIGWQGKKRVSIPVLLFFLLPTIAVIAELARGRVNNFLIFKGVFWHTLQQQNLFAAYPAEYWDTNHYGPFFSIVIAPFAVLPLQLGVVLWVVTNAFCLYRAAKELPVAEKAFLGLLLIMAVENMTASHNLQSNALVASWIIFSYTLVRKEKDFWAALFVVAGTLMKLYGVVGLLFFLFSKNKVRYLAGLVFWGVVCFCLPMLLSGPRFVVQSYFDWYASLAEKNELNTSMEQSISQDISFPGMVRRISGHLNFSGLWLLAPAGLLALLPLLRRQLYGNTVYQLHYLALLLISVVIFSSSAESATYVIAMAGVGIWFVQNNHRQHRWVVALLAFAIILTSLSPTDLFPKQFKRTYITAYSLKALPCVLIWFAILGKLLLAPSNQFKSPQVHES